MWGGSVETMSKSLFALAFAGSIMAASAALAQAPTIPMVPPAEVVADLSNRLNIQLSNGGTVVIQLRPDAAPQNVYRIKQLASTGFYNGLSFHRVIPGFMAQGGDPLGNGMGGSKLPDVPAEFNALPHMRGAMAMARSQAPDSANSQFYIMLSADLKLDKNYTVIGRVISGMDAVDRIAVGEPPAEPTRVVRAWIDAPLPAMAAAPAPTAEGPHTTEPAKPEAAPAQ